MAFRSGDALHPPMPPLHTAPNEGYKVELWEPKPMG